MNVKLMPLISGRKEPLKESYQSISDDPTLHQEWIKRGFNIAYLLAENGCSAADFDEKDAARRFYADHLRENTFNCITETFRGAHFIWRGETHTRKMYDATGNEIGDIKGNGYLVFPNSVVKDWQYRFVEGFELHLDRLLPFPEELFPEVRKTVKITREKIRKLDAYLAKVESVQGKHGSFGLVRAAAICRDTGLTEAETTIKLLWWNTLPVVSPPWSHEELARAISNTFLKGDSQ